VGFIFMILFKKIFALSPQEIAYAFSHAHAKKYGPGIKLLASYQYPTQPLDHGKMLIIIPGKSGKAHDRNKFRRQARALFYEEKLYQKPLLLILLVHKQGLTVEFAQLKKFLITAIGEL
jgi:ribonuclease P protein component